MWTWKFRYTCVTLLSRLGWGFAFWTWLACSCICLIPHCLDSFPHLLLFTMLLPMPAMAFPSSQPRKTLLLPQGPDQTPAPCTFPTCPLLASRLPPPPKVKRNHSNLRVPITVLYMSTGALITLYGGMTCRNLTSHISKGPVSVFFEFPAISTVPGTEGL